MTSMNNLFPSMKHSSPVSLLENWKGEICSLLHTAGGMHLYEDIVIGVLTGYYQIWYARAALTIGHEIVYPRKKHYNIFIAVGDLEELKKLEELVISYAKCRNYASLVTTCRKGWIKIGESRNWEQNKFLLERKL